MALAGGLDWDGPAVAVLLGKGDNNKAARVRVSARARARTQAQGPGRGNGQAYLPRHTVPPPSGSTRYLGILPALLPCCCCQSCVHPCLVTEDCWLHACYQPWKELCWTYPGRRPGRCPGRRPGWWDGAAIKGYVSAPLWPPK